MEYKVNDLIRRIKGRAEYISDLCLDLNDNDIGITDEALLAECLSKLHDVEEYLGELADERKNNNV